MVMPAALNTRAVTSSDNGMAVSEMTVVRTFSRKAKSTITTRMAPSRRASSTLVRELLMNSDWRNRRVLNRTSLGSEGCRSAKAASTCLVKSRVLAPGCFSTLRMTAGRPFTLPSPRLKRAPNRTSATCLTAMGEPAR